MKKLSLVILVLLAFPIFQAKADIIVEKEIGDYYYYQKEICNVINNFNEIINDYDFYYLSSSPGKDVSFRRMDSKKLSEIKKCLEVHTGGMYGPEIVLISKKNNDLITEYNNSLEKQSRKEQFVTLEKIANSGLIIYLNNYSLSFSIKLPIVAALLQETYEVNYYNLSIDKNNKAIFTKISEPVEKRNSRRAENIALTVVITSFVSMMALLYIKRKLSKEVNE